MEVARPNEKLEVKLNCSFEILHKKMQNLALPGSHLLHSLQTRFFWFIFACLLPIRMAAMEVTEHTEKKLRELCGLLSSAGKSR